MAVIIPSKSSTPGLSVSNMISRFRSKRKANPKNTAKQDTPEDTRPPLIPSPLPLVLPEHQNTLPALGWTTITFPQPICSESEQMPSLHPLQVAYETLFVASQAFFNSPTTEKQKWAHKLGTEEGWSCIPGEKEFITLRTLEYCPEILRAPAEKYWNLMGSHLSRTLERINTSLALPTGDDSGLQAFVGPCATMPSTETSKTATMLRLFRYETHEPKIVAEPHSDLGLLSVVVGDVPGLEVWDGHGWFAIEREVRGAGMMGASLLVGRHLERLTNGRWVAGGHRVVSYGDNTSAMQGAEKSVTSGQEYRFSIVFVLRAHESVRVRSGALETGVTGRWEGEVECSAGEMFAEIKGKCFNVNLGAEEREKQRRDIERRKVEAGVQEKIKV
ncbi:hypothetical protein GQ44DRAFT_706490 [Phaeosphaeriaceae sp. PMI808]|nr:hypothetical protein GQ44DRAFT_706490 [Phaeosphaeriaceae sp. PMI808]